MEPLSIIQVDEILLIGELVELHSFKPSRKFEFVTTHIQDIYEQFQSPTKFMMKFSIMKL